MKILLFKYRNAILLFNCIFFLKTTTVFQAQPPTPPSAAQSATKTNEQSPFLHSVKRLVCNRNYILLLISYGVNVGVFYAISTLLNQVIEFIKIVFYLFKCTNSAPTLYCINMTLLGVM